MVEGTPASVARTEWRRFALYAGVTFAFSWLCFLPQYFVSGIGPVGQVLVVVGGFGPLVGALVGVSVDGGSVRSWFRDRVRYPGIGLLLTAVGVALCIEIGRLVVYAPVGNQLTPGALGAYIHQPAALVAVPINLALSALFSGGQEELGWRGYALPVLQSRFSATAASALIGIVWALWHLPFYIFGDRGGVVTFLAFAIVLIPLSMVLAAMFNASHGSVLPAMLLHGGTNFVQGRARDFVVTTSVSWPYELAVVPILLIIVAGLASWYGTAALCSGPPIRSGSTD